MGLRRERAFRIVQGRTKHEKGTNTKPMPVIINCSIKGASGLSQNHPKPVNPKNKVNEKMKGMPQPCPMSSLRVARNSRREELCSTKTLGGILLKLGGARRPLYLTGYGIVPKLLRRCPVLYRKIDHKEAQAQSRSFFAELLRFTQFVRSVFFLP